jgi:hypothetical protein
MSAFLVDTPITCRSPRSNGSWVSILEKVMQIKKCGSVKKYLYTRFNGLVINAIAYVDIFTGQ